MSAVGGPEVRRARVGRSIVLALMFTLMGVSGAHAAQAHHPTFSVLVPIVAQPGATDLLTSEELTAMTAPGGSWAELAHSAISHGATLAIDSRIVTSIETLGSDAPAVAKSWLESVKQSGPVYLVWGNADPFVLAMTTPPFRVSTIQLSEISGIPAASIIGWPSGLGGNNRSLRVIQQLGYTSLITDDVAFPEAPGAFSHETSVKIAEAVAPGSSSDIRALVSRLRLGGGAVLALPRDPNAIDTSRAVMFLDALFDNGSRARRFTPTAVSDVGSFVFHDVPEIAIRLLMFHHRADRQVSTIAVDPAVISTPRLRRLCVVAGTIGTSNFGADVRSLVRNEHSYEEFVTFSLGSDFTVLANSTELPLTITNTTASDITVVATVNATSGIVRIDKPTHKVTVPAGSSVQVTFPMSSVANGRTSLRATLNTAAGLAISEPAYVEIDVQAQWEGVTLFIFVGLVSTMLSIGIIRQIRDRRPRS